MKLSKKILASVLLIASVFSFLSFLPSTVKKVHATELENLMDLFSEYVSEPTEYYYTKGTVAVDDINVPTLFRFTSNGENDVYWYPGVVSSVKTAGNGGAGTTYVQTLDFGGFQLISNLNILYRIPNNTLVQKATGAFENYAIYSYDPLPGGGAELTIYSAVRKAPGVDVATLEFILNNTFPMLLNYLGKTGTYSVLVLEG